jgi:transcriptional regulator with XRE-family HTH domain
MQEIGKTIKNKREENKMTINELSEKCGCSYGTIINVEAGRSVTLSVLEKICKVLDLKINISNN